MQNYTPMTKITSKSKPEIVIQYGGRRLSETGSSFISAVDWDMSSKFCMPIDFRLLKQKPSLNLNSKVDFRLCGRHLETSIWRHNFTADRLIITKFSRQTQNDMLITIHRLKSKPEVKFQYGGRPFSETGSSFYLSRGLRYVIEIWYANRFLAFYLLKQMLSLNLNYEVDFRLYGRHLEKSIWRHNSTTDRPIITKFSRQMQNDMPLTKIG